MSSRFEVARSIIAIVATSLVLGWSADVCSAQDSSTVESSSVSEEAAVPTPAPSPSPSYNYWKGPWATGDWGGARGELKENGVELDFRFTTSYQGMATGAESNYGAWGGKVDTDFKFDMGKLAGWTGFSWQVRTETRFGRFPHILGAKLVPVTYLITPKTSGTVFAISALNFTQTIALSREKGNFIAIGAGRYYGFDGADSPFNGGGGHTTFLHLAFNGTPTHGRLVPSVSNGFNFAWIKKGNPFITFSIRDANGYPTKPGLKELFKDGMTFINGVNFPSKFGGKTGKHSFTFMITTKKFTPFDDFSGELNPAPPGVPPTPRSGSWIVQYKAFQYFREKKEADGSTTGWGIFGTFVVADGRTNKSGLVATIGAGGRGPFRSRKNDRWGIGFSVDGVSLRYREQVGPLVNINSEHVFETFYSFGLTPFLNFSPHLQVVRPMLIGSGVAVMPGARMVVNF